MSDESKSTNLLVSKESSNYAGAERVHNRSILMNGRMGIRIEFDIDLGILELWINPRAGKSLSCKDVNFSCRDDFTTVFNKISLPRLNPTEFIRCEYDPFHSTMFFKNQTIHILSLINQPIVILKFEAAEYVDIKSDKADDPIYRSDDNFVAMHPDRGYTFEFGALITNGSTYRHQVGMDVGRSAYARATMNPDSLLILSATLKADSISNIIQNLYSTGFDEISKQNSVLIEQAADCGIIKINNDEKFEKLLEINKRILISAQNESGAIQAAFKRIYYLLWIRDGGMIWSLCSYAGMSWPMKSWTEFALANPTEINDSGIVGKMFGQMSNPNISKWQEDGAFYVTWTAFTHWTQTGSMHFLGTKSMDILKESVRWLEGYCFDQKLGLFGRYFMCETPFKGSHDFEWDNAVGKQTFQLPAKYNGKVIKRSYDIYINAFMHSVYLMIAAMEIEAGNSTEFVKKANAIECAMLPFYEGFEPLPSYGYVEYEGGEIELVEPFGLDKCDYQWGLSLAMFLGNPLQNNKIRNSICKEMTAHLGGLFVAGYASVLSSLDSEFIDEKIIVDAIDYAAKQSYRPGDYLCMPNTIVEILDVKDGDIFHDVRPQNFSISAMLAATANLGIRKLPFSLAVRATKQLNGIKNYEYLGGKINFEFVGTGKINSVLINGRPLEDSWVLPQDLFANPLNSVIIEMSEDAVHQNTLIYTTVRVLAKTQNGFDIKAYGKNQLLFKGLNKQVRAYDGDKSLNLRITNEGEYSLIEFEGLGNLTLELE